MTSLLPDLLPIDRQGHLEETTAFQFERSRWTGIFFIFKNIQEVINQKMTKRIDIS